MRNCRICGSALHQAVYFANKPSLTSVCTFLDVPMSLFLCQYCGLGQKPALPEINAYYDKEYRISMQSRDFDQLYDEIDGRKIYRSDYQVEVLLKTIKIPRRAKVLDYGAGKATTLSKLMAIRPDIVPCVFDVSDEYRIFWDDFIPTEQQATHNLPASWQNIFSLIMVHFVLEHAEDPCEVLVKISKLLTPNGAIVFMVPDCIGNPGDMIAIDHINHFSSGAINFALSEAGLVAESLDWKIFRGAIVCLARRARESSKKNDVKDPDFEKKIRALSDFWSSVDKRLRMAAKSFHNCPSAIYGAGVYGSHIASRIKNHVLFKCFIDSNPHLANITHMGMPVRRPTDMPEDIEIIYAGLNPKIARDVLEPFRTGKVREIVYLD
jgi:SAM-dependent methyltransferase